MAEAAKSGGSSKKDGGPAAKRVIDAKATEVSKDIEAERDGDDSDDIPATTAGTPGRWRGCTCTGWWPPERCTRRFA